MNAVIHTYVGLKITFLAGLNETESLSTSLMFLVLQRTSCIDLSLVMQFAAAVVNYPLILCRMQLEHIHFSRSHRDNIEVSFLCKLGLLGNSFHQGIIKVNTETMCETVIYKT